MNPCTGAMMWIKKLPSCFGIRRLGDIIFWWCRIFHLIRISIRCSESTCVNFIFLLVPMSHSPWLTYYFNRCWVFIFFLQHDSAVYKFFLFQNLITIIKTLLKMSLVTSTLLSLLFYFFISSPIVQITYGRERPQLCSPPQSWYLIASAFGLT